MFGAFGAEPWLSNAHARPVEYEQLVHFGIVGTAIPPWSILSLDEVVSATSTLHRATPDQKLVVFARRGDTEQMACWEADSTTGQVMLCTSYPTGETSVQHPTHTFWGWFRSVVDVFVENEGRQGLPPSSDSQEVAQRFPGRPQLPLLRAVGGTNRTFAITRKSDWLDNVTIDPWYLLLQARLLTSSNWFPWRFLPGVEIIARSNTLYRLYPERELLVFAHNLQDDALACWDTKQSDGTIYLIHNWSQTEPARHVSTCPNMLQWFRHVVVEDFITEGEKRISRLRVED